MADPYLRQHALAHLALAATTTPQIADPGVRLWLAPARGQLALRGDPERRPFVEAVRGVLSVAPPREANSVAAGHDLELLWLGPDEWLIVCADGRERDLAPALETALDGEHHLVTDVSHSRCILGLSGRHAREVLQKGCALDLHPRAFGPGRCAQTSLARAHALVQQLDDAPSFQLYVHRSFADYLFRWLRDAADEYGLVVGER